MGLVAHIDRSGPSVTIRLAGQIREAELDQLGAIVTHYHDRGCQTFLLDLTGTLPLGPVASEKLAAVLCSAAPNGSTCLEGDTVGMQALPAVLH